MKKSDGERKKCPTCGREILLMGDGRFRRHPPPVDYPVRVKSCPRSGSNLYTLTPRLTFPADLFHLLPHDVQFFELREAERLRLRVEPESLDDMDMFGITQDYKMARSHGIPPECVAKVKTLMRRMACDFRRSHK